MKNTIVLYLGIGLIILGLVKPDLSNLIPSVIPNNHATCLDNYVLTPPTNTSILEKCNSVIDILQSTKTDNKRQDTLKLSSLYADIATLIRIDGEDQVVKDTQSIREINSLAGQMLKLDIKGLYPNLAQANKAVIEIAVGGDEITLSAESREMAAQAFDGLSWAFYEGGK